MFKKLLVFIGACIVTFLMLYIVHTFHRPLDEALNDKPVTSTFEWMDETR